MLDIRSTLLIGAFAFMGVLAFLVASSASADEDDEMLKRQMIHAQILVEQAIKAYKRNPEDAFELISDPDGVLADGDMYAWVQRLPEMHLVASANPNFKMGPATTARSAATRKLIKEKATPEGAWVEYQLESIETGELMKKKAWVVLVDEYTFGSGVLVPLNK